MPITESTVARARYYPELLPDARFATLPAGSEMSPPILDFRRLNKAIRLVNLSTEQIADTEARFRADSFREIIPTAGLPDQVPNDIELLGTNLLQYALYSTGGVANFRTYFGLWVYEMTVAEKLALGIRLSPDESRIATSLNLAASVEKGVLPYSLDYIIDKEYVVVQKVAHTAVTDLATGEEATINTLSPRTGELLVLTSLAAQPGTVVQNIRLRISRDDADNYLELYTYPLALEPREVELKCWVPALRELKIKAIADDDVNNHTIRYTVARVLLTNILKVRFGLMTREDAPGDVWDKVKGGIL